MIAVISTLYGVAMLILNNQISTYQGSKNFGVSFIGGVKLAIGAITTFMTIDQHMRNQKDLKQFTLTFNSYIDKKNVTTQVF